MSFLLRLKICFAAIKHAWQCCDDVNYNSRFKDLGIVDAQVLVNLRITTAKSIDECYLSGDI